VTRRSLGVLALRRTNHDNNYFCQRRLHSTGEEWISECIVGLIAIATTPFFDGGVSAQRFNALGVRLGGRARLDAGQLLVYLAPRLRTRDLPLLLIKALLGHGRSSGEFEIVSAAEVTIDSRTRRRLRVAIDGEVRQLPPPLRYRLRARALRVILPQA